MTQVIIESPMITLAGTEWFPSLRELSEPFSSLLTGWSLWALRRFILHLPISVYSPNPRRPTHVDFWTSVLTNLHPLQNSALRFSELTVLSPQLKSLAWDPYLFSTVCCMSPGLTSGQPEGLPYFSPFFQGSQNWSVCCLMSKDCHSFYCVQLFIYWWQEGKSASCFPIMTRSRSSL